MAALKPFKPGDHPNDYRYLFEGHDEVLTPMERRSRQIIIMREKMPTVSSKMQRRWMGDNSEAIISLLQEGEDSFYARTFERVLRENPEGLRTCPRCGSLCRTSKACLCPHCSHNWYEERSAG